MWIHIVSWVAAVISALAILLFVILAEGMSDNPLDQEGAKPVLFAVGASVVALLVVKLVSFGILDLIQRAFFGHW